MSFVEPVVLTGQRWVTLEPLTPGHVDEIAVAAADGDPGALWFTFAPSPHTAQAWVDTRLADPNGFTFVVRALDGTLIGSSSYLNIDGPNRRLEIGSTWYGASARRTGVNTEAKLLLLTHAFEELGMGRVQLKTDHMNQRSQAAIARIGAQREGVLRRHRLRPDGTWRDSVYFSILIEEWPAAKARLSARV